MRYLLIIFICVTCVRSDILEELSDKKELLFDRRNIAKVKQLLPYELYQLLIDSEDVIKVFASIALPEFKKDITPFEGDLSDISRTSLPKGFPFSLNDESPISFYWNLQSRLWESAAIKGDFILRSFDNQREIYTLRGSYERVYPSLLPLPPKLPQIFRERIRFNSPKAVDGYSWVSFRFFGDEEDYLLVASPLIKETRVLTGSNRSDSLIGGLISLEDLFLLGSKSEYINVSFIEEQTMLLPFVDSYSIESGECESAKINDESDRIQRTNPLMKWTPRRTKSIEVTVRDPFHEYGRIMLFVDSELLVPTMAQVYDRNGNFKKVMILGNQITSTVFPVILNVISKDNFEYLTFTSFSRCQDLPLDIFDPRNQLSS